MQAPRPKLLNVRSLDLPMYNPEAANVTESASRMCERMHDAHGLIWASPMYHGTISGSFKNALDWLQLLADRDPRFSLTKSSASSAPPEAYKEYKR